MQHGLFFYLDLKPEGPCGGVEAVRVENKVLAAQVELRRPVPEGPGGQTGPPVRHQVEGHVTRTCTGWSPSNPPPTAEHQIIDLERRPNAETNTAALTP